MTTPNRFKLGESYSLSKLIINGEKVVIENSNYTSSGVDTYGEDENGDRKSKITLYSNEELKQALTLGDQIYIEAKTDVTDTSLNKTYDGKLVIHNGKVTGVGENVEIELLKEEDSTNVWELVVYDQAI